MGGTQEWLIRTVRVVLSSLLQDQAQELDDETLWTLFTEAENVVNSRPLMIGKYQIQIRMKQSLRTTSLHLKPALYYHLLATSGVQIYTQESGGTEYITCQISFGVDGKESIACRNKNVRNGTKSVLTVKLVMSSWSVTRLALETSGHSPTSRRIYPAMMVWFVKSVCLLLNALQGPSTTSFHDSSPKRRRKCKPLWPEYDLVGEPKLIPLNFLEQLRLFMLIRCNFINSYNVWGSHVTPSQL